MIVKNDNLNQKAETESKLLFRNIFEYTPLPNNFGLPTSVVRTESSALRPTLSSSHAFNYIYLYIHINIYIYNAISVN
jgi:hypothetical protein